MPRTEQELSSMAAKRLLKAQVLQRYERDQPGGGEDFADWCQSIAQEINTDDASVRRTVLQYTNGYLNDIRVHSLTHSQRVAEVLGAGVVEAVQVLQGGLKAMKKRPIINKEGDLLGEYESPDWVARMSAATKLLDIHGSWAPKQIEVRSENVSVHLTDEQLLAEFKKLNAQLQSGRKSRGQVTAAKGTADSGGTEGEAVSEGQLLLADGDDADGGRTERDAVQAVPEVGVHPVAAGSAGPRAGDSD